MHNETKIDQIDKETLTLYDLKLETQVSLCESLKKLKDIEKGRTRGHGFGNVANRNSKRDVHIYTFLEEQFKDLSISYGLKLSHEVRIKVRDRLDKTHIFKLDFWDARSFSAIEINPSWHIKYTLVNRRDALRTLLLKRIGIKVLNVSATQKGSRNYLNRRSAKRALKYVLNAKPSRNSLLYYMGGER
jgi:hypothetical protein